MRNRRSLGRIARSGNRPLIGLRVGVAMAGSVLLAACGTTSPPPAPTSVSPASTPAASAAAAATAADAAPKDWPIGVRGEPDRRGVGDQGPVGNPVLRWRFRAKASVSQNPAVANGVVYVASDDGVIHALATTDGKELWSVTPSGASGPAVLPYSPLVMGGLVYEAEQNGVVHALDATTGVERWKSPSGIGGSDATMADGDYIVSTVDGAVVALDGATGAQRWRFAPADAGRFHNPAAAGGVVYVASDKGGCFAIDAATGQQRWHVDTGGDSTGTVVVAGGIAYVGAGTDNPSAPSHLRALDAAAGTERWRVDAPIFSPAVAGGLAISGSEEGLVEAHDTGTGAERWRFQVRGPARPPTIAAGVAFIPSEGERRVFALDATSGKEIWQFDVDGTVSQGLAVTGGSIYVGTSSGSVYAIGGDGSATIASTDSPGPGSSTAPIGSPTLTSSTAPSPSAAPAGSGAPAARLLWASTGGTGSHALSLPNALAIDPHGRVWVADVNHNRFAIFTPDGKFLEDWGTAGSGPGQFRMTRGDANGGGIAFAPDGSFYVLDIGNERVEHFDKDRAFLKSWGSAGMGPGQFTDPAALVVDAKGLVHVLDDARDVVETYDANGRVLGSFALHVAGAGSVNFGSMAIDRAGNVFVGTCCAAGNGVRKYDPSGTQVGTVGSVGTGPGQFSDQPIGVVVDAAGRLFVSMGPEGDADRVLAFDGDGRFLGSFGRPGSGDGQFGFATSLALDGRGDIYVTDAQSIGNFGGVDRVEKLQLLGPLASG